VTHHRDLLGARKHVFGGIHTCAHVAKSAMVANICIREARIDDIVVTADGVSVTVRILHDRLVRNGVVLGTGIENARKGPFSARCLVIRQHVAVVEALPASATPLQEDQKFFGVPRPGEH
jgi:hypothetical protein